MTWTEKLRDRMTKLIFKHKFPNLDWESYVDTMVEKQQCTILATQILRICQEAGLAFVVKKRPPALPIFAQDAGGRKAQNSYEQAQQDMLKAGFRQTEEIETREPR